MIFLKSIEISMFCLSLNTGTPNFIRFLNFYLGKAASFFAKTTLPSPTVTSSEKPGSSNILEKLKLLSIDLPNNKNTETVCFVNLGVRREYKSRHCGYPYTYQTDQGAFHPFPTNSLVWSHFNES